MTTPEQLEEPVEFELHTDPDPSLQHPDASQYESIAQNYGTGLLPAAVWAESMGHPAPDLAVFTQALVPSGPLTWQQYLTGREAMEENAR